MTHARLRYVATLLVGVILTGCNLKTSSPPSPQGITPSPTTSQTADTGATNSPNVSLRKYSQKMLLGTSGEFQWQVSVFLLPDDMEKLPYTKNAIFYDTVSRPGNFGIDVAPEAAGYSSVLNKYYATGWFQKAESSTEDLELVRTDKGDYATSSWTGDRQFITTFKAERIGKYYFRAHIFFNGKHYWTPENQFEVVEKY